MKKFIYCVAWDDIFVDIGSNALYKLKIYMIFIDFQVSRIRKVYINSAI